MRMWMVNPTMLCRNHLLGEHQEIHMLIGCILKNRNIEGFVKKGFVTTNFHEIICRHNELVFEMLKRGYCHNSPVENLFREQFPKKPENYISIKYNIKTLKNRCSKCKERFEYGK